MNDNKKKLLWLGLITTMILGALWQFCPLNDAKKRLERFPLAGNGFQGYNTPLNDFERHAFKKANLLKRVYQVGDQKCFITILDGTNDRHIVHDPFYCFRGGGWQLVKRRAIPIHAGKASLLIMKKGLEKREVLLWFSNGYHRHGSALYYFFQATLRRLTLGLSGPEPVLIVIQPFNRHTLDWNQLLEGLPYLQQL